MNDNYYSATIYDQNDLYALHTIDQIEKWKFKDFKNHYFRFIFHEIITQIERMNTYIFDDISFSNLNQKTLNYINSQQFKTDFEFKKLKLYRLKSRVGNAGFVYSPSNFDSSLNVSLVQIMDYPQYIQDKLIDIYVTKNLCIHESDQDYLEFYHFYYKNNRVYVETLWTPKQSLSYNYFNQNLYEVKNLDIHIKDEQYLNYTNEIPITIAHNNEEDLGESSYALFPIAMQVELEKDLNEDYKFLRTNIMVNKAVNPHGVQQLSEGIKKGDRVFGYISREEIFAGSFNVLNPTILSTELNLNITEKWRQKIMEQCFKVMTSNTRNNKYSSETMTRNFNGFNYMNVQKRLMDYFWKKHYKFYLDLSKKLGYFDGEIPEIIEVEQNLSPYAVSLMSSFQNSLNKNSNNKKQPKENKENTNAI